MKKFVFASVVLGLAVGLAPMPLAQEKPPAAMRTSQVAQTPEWQAIKSLAGNWEGTFEEGGQKMPAAVEMRLTGDGSALMHWMGKDTPYEMVTMFHPDGDRLLATHYCAAHNQPRMALAKGASAKQLRFEFVDGTNIKPGDTHMHSVVLTITDADHHSETWTSVEGGKQTSALFTFARKK